MFSTDVTSAEPTKLLTCDASAWGQVSEKRTHGWRGTGIRDCVPGSRATASCLQPLHKRGHSAPRPPRAAQLLPRAGGRAPRREMGHAGGHPGLFLQKLREGGCPTWGRGGQGRSPERERGMQAPSPRHRRAQALRTPPPRGGRLTRPLAGVGPAGPAALAPPRPGPCAAHLPVARGARAPAPPLCSSSGQTSPRALPARSTPAPRGPPA